MTDVDQRADRGRRAERLAARHLTGLGFTIEATNWHCRGGELDIVACRGELLVFVEVRSVTTGWLASPSETVNPAKQARVGRAADAYLQQRREAPTTIRFDVIAIRLLPLWRAEIEHIEDAFIPSWAI